MASTIHSIAQKDQQLPLLKELLRENPKLVNDIDVDGRAPLHWAASSGSINIAEHLIDNGAEINQPDSSRWTPLHIAVSAGHTEIVEALVGAGADVNKKNDKDITPLYDFSKARFSAIAPD
ncbi:prosome, macropain 26S subunit, non-ATPase, 10, isoform CRA_c [Hygrophoropsis aurantiaca]|uniref:Prosome, macropain 26S subunit, non-ATPase, 10, isoform CRA_c n=1 Tax=Hygrophoropsis aurantiaca TaxID=72124 RepID=A0ACB8AF25_9AGAM|nr:prosome, macropain 26S subunit, non-ATPase, 10, isoform CRA_c [Hygrophoropsis aurantiaca]